MFNRIKTRCNKVTQPHESIQTKVSRPVYLIPDIKIKVGTSPDTRTTPEQFGMLGEYQQAIENIHSMMNRMATAQDDIIKRMDEIEHKNSSCL